MQGILEYDYLSREIDYREIEVITLVIVERKVYHLRHSPDEGQDN